MARVILSEKPSSEDVSKKKNNKKDKLSVVRNILIIIGVLMMLYPIVATLYNNNRLARISEESQVEVSSTPDFERERARNEMLNYNQDIKNRPVTPVIGDDNGDERYQQYLKTGYVKENVEELSQITIPDINVNLPVYRGTSDSTLRRGAGHLYGTSMPIGGAGTNSTITAHSGLESASMFDNLNQLEIGEPIYVTTMGEKMKYEMRSSRVVPADSQDAIPTGNRDKDLLVLITCTPYGINTDRLVVYAARVPMDEGPSSTNNIVSTWQHWMTAVFVMMIALLVMIFWGPIRSAYRIITRK